MLHQWPLSNWCSQSSGPESSVLPRSIEAGTREGITGGSGTRQAPEPGVRCLALQVEYEGTQYKGFQYQANGPSIQSELERAIKGLTGETIRVRGASRTDSGAHATGQVVDFRTMAPYPAETVVRALNWYLPQDIRVTGAWEVQSRFNARKDAVGRVYRYTILNTRRPSAVLRRLSHWVQKPLDLVRMQGAAALLPGIRDVSAFTTRLPAGSSGIRRIDRWDVWGEGNLVLIEAEGNAFLPYQVRRTNGVLVEIGLGRLPVTTIGDMLEGKLDKPLRSPLLPAKGLCLMRVNYSNSCNGKHGQHET